MDQNKIARLAAMLQAQTRDQMTREGCGPWQVENVIAMVKPGRQYAKLDIGPRHNMSGKYMIDMNTGDIFGIEGYGTVNKRRYYGTLDTVDSYYWGGYAAIKMGPTFPEHLRPNPADYSAAELPTPPEFTHTYQAGDILYSSYGYDQTNIDFYQVVRTTQKSITVRELKQIRGASAPLGDSWQTLPAPNCFIDNAPEHTRTVKAPFDAGTKGNIKIDSLMLKQWDGRPLHASDGH